MIDQFQLITKICSVIYVGKERLLMLKKKQDTDAKIVGTLKSVWKFIIVGTDMVLHHGNILLMLCGACVATVIKDV